MTTPEDPDTAAAPRVTRPEPARDGPRRKAATATGALGAAAGNPPHHGVRDPDVLRVNEAVAHTVRSAYDVLGDTIEQGRRAAEQFRVGAYNVRDVPDDVSHLARRLLSLARQLSAATFDVCEALLQQSGNPLMTPPPPGSTPTAPFYAHPETPPHPSAPPAPPPPMPAAPPPGLALAVAFNGRVPAKARTSAFERPSSPVAPADIACDALVQRGGGGAPVSAIAFAQAPAGRGLLATITIPEGQAPGIYSGVVYCRRQDLLLGVLEIEIG